MSSETSILNASSGNTQPGFWRRQFAGTATEAQIVFDVMVGILLPILCLIFDPFVFRSGGSFGGGILKSYQLFAYTVIGLEILTLAVWLMWGERVREWASAIGGILLAGAIFSFSIACVLLPFSLLGLIFYFIGALGFTPFITGFIYLRNGRRALRVLNAKGYELAGALLLGTVFVLGGPAVAQWKISEMVTDSVQELISGDSPQPATTRLKYMNWVMSPDLDALVSAYRNSTDEVKRARLARAYREITGQGIESRFRSSMD